MINVLQRKTNHNAFTKYTIKQKDAKNEAKYEESSVTYEVQSNFNIFKCGGNILNRLYVTYEQACMATPKDKYYTKLLETLIEYNCHHNAPLSNETLRKAISTFMKEMEEEERDAKHNVNNVTMDTFYKSPFIINTKGNIANISNESQISSKILAEIIKGFKGFTLQSKIYNSLYYHSEEDDAESDTNSD